MQELNAQAGDFLVSAVTILPTVRINGQQYRGTLDVGGARVSFFSSSSSSSHIDGWPMGGRVLACARGENANENDRQ